MSAEEEETVVNGLRALYKFDGNGVNSISGSGLPGNATKRSGSFSDNDFQDRSGGYGKALASNVDALTPNLGINPYSDNYTICFWMKVPPYNGSGVAVISSNYISRPLSIRDIGIIFIHYSNTQYFTGLAIAGRFINTFHTVTPGQWIFVALRKDGNTRSYSINSNTFTSFPAVTSTEQGDSSNITDFRLTIGYSDTNIPGGYLEYDSSIDSLRVYNRAISVNDLVAIRGWTPPTQPPPPPPNRPPVLLSIGNKSVTVNEEIVINLSATDRDGDSLTFSKRSNDVGTLSGSTFRWTPTSTGSSSVRFTVSDGRGGSDSETITITVNPPGPTPPRLLPIGNKAVKTGQNITFVVRATDPDNLNIIFSSSRSNMLVSTTRTVVSSGITYREADITWNSVPQGNHSTTIKATSVGGTPANETDTETIRIIATTNNPPTIMVAGNLTWFADQVVILQLSGTDSDGTFKYAIDSGEELGMYIDQSTGLFTWIPYDIQDGAPDEVYTIGFKTIDNDNAESMPRLITLTIRSRPSVPYTGVTSSGDADILAGAVTVYDDKDTDVISDWVKVISRDYNIEGKLILDNGIVRVIIGNTVNNDQVISVHRIDVGDITGKEIFTITPLDDNGNYIDRAGSITFGNIGINQVIVNVRYGDIVLNITLGRGMPYCNIASNTRKISVHRSMDSGVSAGSANYIESMIVPAFRGNYQEIDVNGNNLSGGSRNNFSAWKNLAGSFGNTDRQKYAKSGLKNITSMFGNYVTFGVGLGSNNAKKYGSVVCFISRPSSIIRKTSSLQGNGGYPSSNFVENVFTFDRQLRIALIDIPSDYQKDSTNIKKFIDLTNEACERAYERNFVRRKE